MKKDEIQEQIAQMRQHVLAGANSFTLGPVILATLIDESDSLRELHSFGEAYGVNELLRLFGDDAPRMEALFGLLDAELVRKDYYKVRFEKYIGCFWREDGEWSWYPESLEGRVIEAPTTLVQALLERKH